MPRSPTWRARRSLSQEEQTTADGNGGFQSVRVAYATLGAEKFYESHGGAYSNPHFELLCGSMAIALDQWHAAGILAEPKRVLDLACGSGEATLALEKWCTAHGVHLNAVEACDPYTRTRYTERTGRPARDWSFADISNGVLNAAEPYDLVLASFCLHLLAPADVNAMLAALARSAEFLCVATPHKQPIITASSGWHEVAPEVVRHDLSESGSARHRVRLRLYRSSASRPREQVADGAASNL